MKRLAFAPVLLMLTWLLGIAPALARPAIPSLTINAVEVSAGHTSGNLTTGATFVGVATANQSTFGGLTISIDYTGAPGPDATTTIQSSSSWSLTATQGLTSLGLLHGTLGAPEGSPVTWNASGTQTNAAIIPLTITGGTYAGASCTTGSGAFSGILTHHSVTIFGQTFVVGTIQGTMNLTCAS